MTDPIFWIWLQEALGAGNSKVDRVIRELDSPETLFHMTADEMRETGIFASKEIERIKAADFSKARENERLAKKYGCAMITPDHPDYPDSLTHIDGMPCVLYVLGELAGLRDELVMTLVGTRVCTQMGQASAGKLAYDLAAAGCTVASGLAAGVDYAAHEGALRAKGRSVGLLACGLDVNYPTGSRDLKRAILNENGVLMTEFPFGTRAFRFNFNIRNRILSGISAGVVVVQAPERSGALNTARHALEQNRDVFAVPGDIFDETMAGCNKLIRDGAKIVVNVYSILEEYIGRFPTSIDARTVVAKIRHASGEMPPAGKLPRKVKKEKSTVETPLMVAQETVIPISRINGDVLEKMGLTSDAQAVYTLLEGIPAGCELFSAKTGFPAPRVMAALTELELNGLARALPGGRYALDGSV